MWKPNKWPPCKPFCATSDVCLMEAWLGALCPLPRVDFCKVIVAFSVEYESHGEHIVFWICYEVIVRLPSQVILDFMLKGLVWHCHRNLFEGSLWGSASFWSSLCGCALDSLGAGGLCILLGAAAIHPTSSRTAFPGHGQAAFRRRSWQKQQQLHLTWVTVLLSCHLVI